jgi:hypothetical protein
MMGRLNHDQRQLFYSFSLEEAVPDDHLVRKIAAVLDLSWVHAELAPHYPNNGRPSIDPELMIRMLIIGYVFAIRSERALCRDVQVNLAPIPTFFLSQSSDDSWVSANSRQTGIQTDGTQKGKPPPLYATRGEAPAPASPRFVSAGGREDNAS